MYVLPTHMYVHYYMHGIHRGKNNASDVCEPPCGFWELNQVSSATSALNPEPLLQPLKNKILLNLSNGEFHVRRKSQIGAKC